MSDYMGEQGPGTVAPGTVEQTLNELLQRYIKRPLYIRGECRNPQEQDDGGWSFDLATVKEGKVYVLQARIWPDALPSIKGRLARASSSLNGAMVEGMRLVVKGFSRAWADSGGLFVAVNEIEPGFTLNGDLYKSDERTLAALKASYPANARLRTPAGSLHSPTENALQVESLTKVMVITPHKSQGLEDLVHHLRNSWRKHRPDSKFKKMTWSGSESAEVFRGYAEEARRGGYDLIVIARGGGHWRNMRAFESEELARAILESKVPVITGVGHEGNVSIADRAARASFSTPTAAAVAITDGIQRKSRAEWKARQTPAAPRPAQVLPSTAKYDRDLAAARQAARSAERELTGVRRSLARTQLSLKTSERNLAAARGELLSARRSRHQHTQDLLDLASHRVRGYSRFTTALTVVGVWALLTYAPQILAFFGPGQPPAVAVLYVLGVLTAGVVSVLLQRSGRKKLHLVSPRRMKHPPESFEDWTRMVKNVRTISRLRQLRLLRPGA